MNCVGLVGYALKCNPRGIGRYTCELISSFISLGLSPVLLKPRNSLPEFKGINLRGANLLPGLLTLGQLEIRKQSQKIGLKLIHDPTGTAPLLVTPQKRIVTIHDVIPFTCPGTSTLLDWLIYHLWLPFAVRGVDQILTDSVNSKQDIVGYLGAPMERITVIPLAAGRQFQPLPAAETWEVLQRSGIDYPYILYVGSLEPRKNLGGILEAFALLREKTDRWHLVVVGAKNFWRSSSHGKFVKNTGLEPFVHFMGYIPDQDLPALYNGADLFIFPSLYEGFGLPVLESMASGTPVITSNGTSLPEVAGEAALLVDPYDVEEIATAMHQVLSNADLAREMRARGLERAKQFSWDRTAFQTIQVYEQLLGKKLL